MREKLIRDRIPELFNIPTTEIRIATEEQFERFLAAKLVEEASECQGAILGIDTSGGPISSDIEELADVLEVVWAIAQARGLDATELERVRADKANERGRFSKRLVWSIPDELMDAPWVSPDAPGYADREPKQRGT